MSGFAAMGLMPELVSCVEEDYGWLLPTDIQDEAIPLILGGGDVMAAAETGSGKTAAFALPLIQLIHERLKFLQEETVADKSPSSIAVVSINAQDKDSSFEFSPSEQGFSCKIKAEDPAIASSSSWFGARATHGVNSGSHYFECRVDSLSPQPTCRVGWSTIASHLELGKDEHGFGYGGKGFLSTAGNFVKFGEPYGPGDVVGCCITFHQSGGSILFTKNGKLQADPIALPSREKGCVFFPAILLQGGQGGAACTVNFGGSPFHFSPPPGYSALQLSDALYSNSDREAYLTGSYRRTPLAVVVEPTLELAEQTFECISDLCKRVPSPSLTCQLLAGAAGNKRSGDSRKRREGGAEADIIVGTMGKLLGMVAAADRAAKDKGGKGQGNTAEEQEGDEEDRLDLSQVRLFVLDEADKLIADSGIPAVMQIFAKCPGGGSGIHRLQVCFFSATLHSPQIHELSRRVCVNPTWVDLKGFESLPEAVHHVVYRVDPSVAPQDVDLKACQVRAITDGVHEPSSDGSFSLEKDEALSQELKELKQQLLVRIIDKYQAFLSAHKGSGQGGRGYSCCVLAGKLSQEQRKKSLALFKGSRADILICTDVNMTLPDEKNVEDYIHRVGRVGRAGKMGLAISLVAADSIQEKVWYHSCSNPVSCNNRNLKGSRPGSAAVLQRVEQRLQQKIAAMAPGTLFALPPGVLRDLAEMEVEAQNIFLKMSSFNHRGRKLSS
eukprot:gene27134-35856_t